MTLRRATLPLRLVVAVSAVLLCFLGGPPSAHATNLLEEDDWTLDLDGSIKGFGSDHPI